MERTIRRGDIFMADLNPIIGSEKSDAYSMLILSNRSDNTPKSPPLTLNKPYKKDIGKITFLVSSFENPRGKETAQQLIIKMLKHRIEQQNI